MISQGQETRRGRCPAAKACARSAPGSLAPGSRGRRPARGRGGSRLSARPSSSPRAATRAPVGRGGRRIARPRGRCALPRPRARQAHAPSDASSSRRATSSGPNTERRRVCALSKAARSRSSAGACGLELALRGIGTSSLERCHPLILLFRDFEAGARRLAIVEGHGQSGGIEHAAHTTQLLRQLRLRERRRLKADAIPGPAAS